MGPVDTISKKKMLDLVQERLGLVIVDLPARQNSILARVG